MISDLGETGDFVDYIGDKYPRLKKDVGYPISTRGTVFTMNGKSESKVVYAFSCKKEAPGIYYADQFELIEDAEAFLKRIGNE